MDKKADAWILDNNDIESSDKFYKLFDKIMLRSIWQNIVKKKWCLNASKIWYLSIKEICVMIERTADWENKLKKLE